MRISRLFAVVTLACAIGVSFAQTTLKLGMQLPETHPSYKGALEIKKKLEEASKGAMTLQIFPNSQLGDFKAMVGQVQAGDLDMAMTGYPDMSYIIPELKLIGAPYVISNYDHLKAVLKGPYGQKMDAKFLEKGIRVADVWYEGARHTTANKPIQSISDLKGLKMRTPNVPFLIEYARAVGATPAPVAFAEVYLALQTKQVDAQENPLPTIEAAKLYEVQKYIALTGHFIASSSILLGDKTWKKLSDNEKKWVSDAVKAGGVVSSGLVAEAEGKLVEFFKGKGLTISSPDTAPFREAMRPYYDKLEEEFGKGEIQKIIATR